ncbi:MAG: DUF192 domain-containing protein [Candidatus Elarobacter sp.]
MWSRSAPAALLLPLLLTAQAPAPSAAPLDWCTAIPLPRADIGTLTSDVDSQTIHEARGPTCRVLVVRGGRAVLHLAVAATDAQRQRGLMGVAYVPAGQGMLFAFEPGEARRYFWMKDTIAPLDMVFVKGDGIVSSVAANVPATKPGASDDAIARREGVGRYVIELGAGDASRLGVTAGTRLLVPEVDGR